MEPIALLWEQYRVAEAVFELEKEILDIKGEISLASDQLQEATRRHHTVVFPFEDKPRRGNPVLKGLGLNLLEKYEDVKISENTLAAIQEYCDLIRDIFG